jgi:hypothetical protein
MLGLRLDYYLFLVRGWLSMGINREGLRTLEQAQRRLDVKICIERM